MGAVCARTYGRKRSRIGGFPSVIGCRARGPDGQGDLHAGRSPDQGAVHQCGQSGAVGAQRQRTGSSAERLISGGLDFYVTETTAHCDYILPVTTMYERDDFPVPSRPFRPRRFGRPPRPSSHRSVQARTEWDIIADLCAGWRAARRCSALSVRPKRSRLFGVRLTPRPVIDGMIRMSQGGNRFGLRRGGLTFAG